MAYIGRDDPHRGDSHGASGLARVVADMLDGTYIYVDQSMIDACFKGEPSEKLRKYIEKVGSPDIVFGKYARDLCHVTSKPPVLIEDDINEALSQWGSHEYEELLCHHLTNELLEDRAREFEIRYPEIKGPLAAVFMGGFDFEDSNMVSLAASKLAEIATLYPEITLFVCPSLRTGENHGRFMKDLEDAVWPSSAVKPMHYVTGESNVRLLTQDYEAAISNYNPYLGLLGKADHIVLLGDSGSIISESLFTGKNIFVAGDNDCPELKKNGYIVDLMEIGDGQFPTVSMPPLNVTRDVAKKIVESYKLEVGKLQL